MRNIYQSKLFVSFYSLVIVFFVVTGCSAVQMKKVTAQKTDYYKFTSQNSGLKISVDPYREENRLKDFFGCDMLSRGVLPVFVVIENLNAEDGYMLVKEQSSLFMINTDPTYTESNLAKSGYDSDKLKNLPKIDTITKLVSSATIMFFPISATVLLPVLGVVAKRSMDEFAIARNIEEKQLLDKTLYQGGFNNGFLYFQLRSKEDMYKVEGLSLSMKEGIRGQT